MISPAQTKPQAIIVDLDGTLAELNGRNPYTEQDNVENDTLNQYLAVVVKMFHEELGMKVIILTGRWETVEVKTKSWLAKHKIPYEKLFMRPIANYDSGTRLKEWYLMNIIFRDFTPVLAFDDLPAICNMYREHGIPAWQVNAPPWIESEV